MLGESNIGRIDFLRVLHTVRNDGLVVMVWALNAQQQGAMGRNVLRYFFKALQISIMVRNMTHHERFFVAIDHEVPNTAVGKSQIMRAWKAQITNVLLG